MDPYLEEPGLWPDVHHEIISVARGLLSGQLRPKYYVRVEERVYVSDEDDPGRRVIAPDLRVVERPGRSGASFQPGGVATLEVAESVEVTSLFEEEIHEARLEIVDREQRQVVTVIEVVSPTNKHPGARGQESYRQKRKEVLSSPSHWVEIDLLRAGAPLVLREILPPCEYTVHVSRVERRPKGTGTVWPIRLKQRLPVISIPLRPGDEDGKLDLQQVLTLAYDRAGYDLELDYRADPVPPLTGELAALADELLRGKGLR
jgi:hypothetical protein